MIVLGKGYQGWHGGYEIRIIEVIKGGKVLIEFMESGATKVVYKVNLKRGEIQDPLERTVRVWGIWVLEDLILNIPPRKFGAICLLVVIIKTSM